MSTVSPTFTLARASVSCTLDVYLQPLGPVKVIDGAAMSIAGIVAGSSFVWLWCHQAWFVRNQSCPSPGSAFPALRPSSAE